MRDGHTTHLIWEREPSEIQHVCIILSHPDLAEVRVDAPENIDFNSGGDQAKEKEEHSAYKHLM